MSPHRRPETAGGGYGCVVVVTQSAGQDASVRHIGVAIRSFVPNDAAPLVEALAAIAPVTSVLVSWSLDGDTETDVLKLAKSEGMGLIDVRHMTGPDVRLFALAATGAFPDDATSLNPLAREPHRSLILQGEELVTAIAKRVGKTPDEVALAWTLHDDGSRVKMLHIEDAAEAVGIGQFELPLEYVNQLRELLIRLYRNVAADFPRETIT